MKLTYTSKGDYLFPDLKLSETEMTPQIGKYGLMRKTYLRSSRKGLYQGMLLNGTLTEHLREIDRQANERMETLMKGLMTSYPPPSRENQTEWAAHSEQPGA